MNRNSTSLSTAELAKLSREFDHEGAPRFLKAPVSQKKRHDALLRKLKRRRGRPRIGGGARRVQITMEISLLRAADRFAKDRGLSRSELIATCLRPVLRRKSA